MSIQKLLKVSVILHHNYFKSVRILYVSMRHVQLNHLESMTCCFDSCGILNKKNSNVWLYFIIYRTF